jgi:hypothetical protein
MSFDQLHSGEFSTVSVYFFKEADSSEVFGGMSGALHTQLQSKYLKIQFLQHKRKLRLHKINQLLLLF